MFKKILVISMLWSTGIFGQDFVDSFANNIQALRVQGEHAHADLLEEIFPLYYESTALNSQTSRKLLLSYSKPLPRDVKELVEFFERETKQIDQDPGAIAELRAVLLFSSLRSSIYHSRFEEASVEDYLRLLGLRPKMVKLGPTINYWGKDRQILFSEREVWEVHEDIFSLAVSKCKDAEELSKFLTSSRGLIPPNHLWVGHYTEMIRRRLLPQLADAFDPSSSLIQSLTGVLGELTAEDQEQILSPMLNRLKKFDPVLFRDIKKFIESKQEAGSLPTQLFLQVIKICRVRFTSTMELMNFYFDFALVIEKAKGNWLREDEFIDLRTFFWIHLRSMLEGGEYFKLEQSIPANRIAINLLALRPDYGLLSPLALKLGRHSFQSATSPLEIRQFLDAEGLDPVAQNWMAEIASDVKNIHAYAKLNLTYRDMAEFIFDLIPENRQEWFKERAKTTDGRDYPDVAKFVSLIGWPINPMITRIAENLVINYLRYHPVELDLSQADKLEPVKKFFISRRSGNRIRFERAQDASGKNILRLSYNPTLPERASRAFSACWRSLGEVGAIQAGFLPKP